MNENNLYEEVEGSDDNRSSSDKKNLRIENQA